MGDCESEGSGRQTPGLRNTNRMRRYREDERANRLEVQRHPDRGGVDAAGIWEESHASYPERSDEMLGEDTFIKRAVWEGTVCHVRSQPRL